MFGPRFRSLCFRLLAGCGPVVRFVEHMDLAGLGFLSDPCIVSRPIGLFGLLLFLYYIYILYVMYYSSAAHSARNCVGSNLVLVQVQKILNRTLILLPFTASSC